MDIKGCLYARVSTHRQAESGHSLPEQLDRLRKYALEKRIPITDDTGAETVYQDDESAKDDDRPGFQQMIKDAKAGKFNTILVISNDRFMRNVKILLTHLDDLRRLGIYVYFHDLVGINVYSDEGRMMLTNLNSFSEYFRGQLSKKTSLGMQNKIREQQWLGAVPYGYELYTFQENKRKYTYLKRNTAHWEVVLLMRKMYSEGKDFKEISDYLNHPDNRVPPPREKMSIQNFNPTWNKVKVRRILMADYVRYDRFLYQEASCG